MRIARLVAAVSLLLALTAAAPQALALPRIASGPTESVTLVLTPRDSAGLHALGAATGLTRAQRLARLASLLPGSQHLASVRSILRALGLTVRAQTPLTVTATAPASLVRALFGSSRSVDPTSAFAQALPELPAALDGLVTAALGGDDTRPAARPAASTIPAGGYTGPQLVSAYGGAAGAGAQSLQNQTLATIQLADWSDAAAVKGTTPSDLSSYAQAAGITLAPGQYTSVVDPNDKPSPDNGSNGQAGGSDEVALDVEALLATAPRAHIRGYFSGNDPAGELQDFIQVGEDASAGYPITAVTTSWGGCEPDTGPLAYAYDDIFSYVLSTGVTIFAASGDAGSTDQCANPNTGAPMTTPSVDFPASSPEVVAVGGTSMPSTSTDGNVSDGTPEPAKQTVWDNAEGASGGGQSTLFTRPAWQLRYNPEFPGLPSTGDGRLVPDIASDADPNTGFEAYAGGAWSEVGGTSLATPTQAALYTDELIAHGIPNGLGDIHVRLYDAPPADFTFVGQTTKGVDYNEMTGLGTPKWDALISAIDVDPGPVAAVTGISSAVYSHRYAQDGYTALGGIATSTPSVVNYHGITYYVVTSTNHEPYVRTDTLGWRALTNYPVDCYQPSVWVGDSANFFVGCTDPVNHAVYVGYTPLIDGSLPQITKGSSGVFTSIGGQAATGPTLIEDTGNLLVEAVVPGGGVWQNSIDNFNPNGSVSATGWTATGFRCADAPSLAAFGSDLYFGCDVPGGAFWLARNNGSGWAAAVDLGGALLGGTGLSVDPAGVVTAFVLGRSGALYSRIVYPHSGAWTLVGGRAVDGAASAEQSG